MSRIRSITLGGGIMLASLVTGEAAAQWNVERFGTARKSVYTTFGLDPALVASAGWASVGSLMDHDFQLTGEVGFATASADVRDFRVRLGTQTSVVRRRSARLTGAIAVVGRGTDNVVYNGFNWGADASATIGWYRPRWFAAGEIGKDKAIVTHVKFSQYYRREVYPGARDGWYLNGGGTVRTGVVGGLTVGRAEVVTRLGFLKSERYNSVVPPVYGTVGLGFGY